MTRYIFSTLVSRNRDKKMAQSNTDYNQRRNNGREPSQLVPGRQDAMATLSTFSGAKSTFSEDKSRATSLTILLHSISTPYSRRPTAGRYSSKTQ